MSTIGDMYVDIIRGIPQALKTRVDVYEVPGLNGYGAQTLGTGDAEFDLVSVLYCINNAAANVHIRACEALQSTVLILVDDYGDGYGNVLVKHVDTNNAKMPLIWNGNTNAVRVSVKWQMVTSF